MRIKTINFFILVIFFPLLGCVATSPKLSSSDNTKNFTNSAVQYLTEYQAHCLKENADTWKHTLCVPIIIIDRESLVAVTNQPDPDGRFQKIGNMYAGKYSGQALYANTALEWGGRQWSMLLWPLPEKFVERMQLMSHEAFHAIQNDLSLPMNSVLNDHLDQEQARVLIRLEWNALLLALENEGLRKSHLASALELRKLRYSKYPNAKKNEEILEMNEGLAEYTGVRLRGDLQETLMYLKKRLANIPNVLSLTRSAAYYSGPLYGLLLDTKSETWKTKIANEKSFGEVAAHVFKIKSGERIKPLRELPLQQYGYAQILSFEKQRALEKDKKIATYLKKIDRVNHLQLPLINPRTMFNPYGILSINSKNAIYITYELNDVWGVLTVADGAYLQDTGVGSRVSVSPPTNITDTNVSGEGWALQLKSGWQLKKQGSIFTVVSEK